MSKSSLTISIESEVLEKARQKFKEKLGKIAEEAYKKELNFVENAPDELKQLELLLELKQDVQRLSTAEGGITAVRMVAGKLKKELGRNPETMQEKISFWETIKRETRKILIRGRLEGEQKVSPAPLPKKGVTA